MFETPITVVGRLVSDPTRRSVGQQDVVKFRLASSARRRTEDGTWEPGDSLFLNVNCWGRLVTGVVASLKKGDAVIVVGSPNSSNSQRLREVAERSGCPNARLVDGARDLDWSLYDNVRAIAITAGASAREVLVNEVIDAFGARFDVTIETVTVSSENTFFPLPRELRDNL